MIRSLCSQLRLGSYISEIYPQIQATDNEDFLIKILNEAAPTERLKKSLDSIFKDYLLNINQELMPNNFQVVVNDYYSLQNFIEKLEKKLK